MFQYFKTELKYLFLNKRSIFLLLVIVASILSLYISNTSQPKDYAMEFSELKYGKVFIEDYEFQLKMAYNLNHQLSKDDYTYILNQLEEIKQNVIEAQQALTFEKDKQQAFYKKCIIAYSGLLQLSKQVKKPSGDDYDYLAHEDIYETIRQKYNLKEYNFQPNDFKMDTQGISMYASFPLLVKCIEIWDTFYEEHMNYLGHFGSDSVSMIVFYFRDLIPLLLVFVLPLLYGDIIAQNRKNGTLKTLGSLPNMRKKYVSIRALLHTSHAFLLLMVPILCFSLCLGTKDHYQNINYPMLSYPEGRTSFTFGYNSYKERQAALAAQQHVSEKKVKFITGMNFVIYSDMDDTNSLDNSLAFIPMWQFLLLCTLLIILVILFMTSLIQMITSFFDSYIIGLIVTMLISFIGYYNLSFVNISMIQAFNPFQYINPVWIVGGTSAYPYLMGICVLIGWSIILLILTREIMKRKAIQ